jgi:hypothetical protein
MARLPRLLRDVTCIVWEPENVDSGDLVALIARLRRFRTDLISLRNEFDEVVLKAAENEGFRSLDVDERSELLGGALTLLIISCRMLCAVSMDMVELLEGEARIYSDQMVELESHATSTSCWTGLFLYQKLSVAQATLKTCQVWQKSSPQSNIVERSGFIEWCDAMHER